MYTLKLLYTVPLYRVPWYTGSVLLHQTFSYFACFVQKMYLIVACIKFGEDTSTHYGALSLTTIRHNTTQ